MDFVRFSLGYRLFSDAIGLHSYVRRFSDALGIILASNYARASLREFASAICDTNLHNVSI